MPQLAVATVPVTPFQQNCTLLWDEASRRAVVIDPGGEPERILAEIADRALAVEAIWLTHGHLDHAGAAEAVKAALGGIPLIGPMQSDQFLLDTIVEDAASVGLTGMQNARPDRWLAEGDVLNLAGHQFDVLHCPGHTPGHVVFVNAAANFAQLGDVLFAGSVGRTDFPYCDPPALIAAIKTKLLPLGDDLRFVCGHGAGSTIGRERRHNPFLQ